MSSDINAIITANAEIVVQMTENKPEIKVEIIGSGPAGADGIAGTTPVKGIDYFTQADIDAIIALTPQDKTFVHTQLQVDNTWIIEHNLNKYPSVTVVDSAGGIVIGQVEYNTVNKITLVFSGAFSGRAYLN